MQSLKSLRTLKTLKHAPLATKKRLRISQPLSSVGINPDYFSGASKCSVTGSGLSGPIWNVST